MREKLASVWMVPLALVILLGVELLTWLFFGAIPAIVVAVVAIQLSLGFFALWLSQRQKRHAKQMERATQGINKTIGKLNNALMRTRQSFTDIDARVADIDASVGARINATSKQTKEVLDLNTEEIRRLAQLPSKHEPHPSQHRILDELTEIRLAINELQIQNSNAPDDGHEASQQPSR